MRLAVFGSPIEHSRSPLLHATAYGLLGLDWEYSRREVLAEQLPGILAELDESWRGLSLTMPLKGAAHAAADTHDEPARITGAVNTLRCEYLNGRRILHGYNTDVAGIVNAIRAARGPIPLAGPGRGHAEILGGGATAASALLACAELGITSVRLLVRTPGRAADTAGLARELGLDASVAAFADYLPRPDTALIVSTLPGDAQPGIVFPEELRASAPLFDVAYAPWPSSLAREWAPAHGTVVSGLEMLVHQALVQVRIFVGGDPSAVLPDEPRILAAMLASVGLPAPATR
ncbi:shikimate dehydrogenase family protein [Mycetocola spongiae]|uniref:shikimate dehydrogenase family protein n=1 Tax=Mycetocola spongiae TaxID=2859226 RepID=UPI001CF0D79C|nr:shikimate dehydrogenase [Mycetocola spongiae]